MFLLNFSHPLTPEHIARLETLLGQKVGDVLHTPAQFDPQRPFLEQLHELLERLPLTPEQWQTEPILVNPPALNVITALLLAELNGRMGYFPPVIRLRPVAGSTPTRFEVAEVLNLQMVRDEARRCR